MLRHALPFLLPIFLFGLFACERPLDIEIPDSGSQLVIISNFTTDQSLRVQVSRSQPAVQPTKAVFILNAGVQLYEGPVFLERLDLVRGEDGRVPVYSTKNFQARVGTEYTIRVEVPGFSPVYATSSIPRQISLSDFKIFDLRHSNSSDTEEDEYHYTVSVSLEDPAEEKNYYHLNFFQQKLQYKALEGDTLITGSEMVAVEFSSSLNNNHLVANVTGGVLFDDKPFNGETVTYTFPFSVKVRTREELIGKLFAELRNVSEEYYHYNQSLSRQQANPDFPFSEPVHLFDNVENGLGIFAGYNASLDSVSVSY